MNRQECEELICSVFSTEADHPFADLPDAAVYRHVSNRKWFALIMSVEKKRLGIHEEGTLDILNVKCDPVMIGSFLHDDGFFPAYHMNKKNWISIALDGRVSSDKVEMFLNVSYDLTK